MEDNGVICMLPWLHFTVTMKDSIRPCCRFSQKSNVTIDNYYKEYEWLRKNMLDGVKTIECTRCYIEDQNTHSMRSTANKNFKLKEINNLTIEPLPLKFIEISLDNTCNLECKMCNSLFSSKLLKRDIMLHDSNLNMFGDDIKFAKPAKVNNKSRFEKLKSLDISWKHLTEIKLLGGEPFLSPQFKEFLIFFISKGNPNNITLEIVTNCTKILQDDVVILLNKFKKIRLTGSIDGIYKYNDYQRVNSNFEDSVKNYKLYLQQLNNISKPHIHITWSILNINCINETIDFWEKEKKNMPGLTISSAIASGLTSPTHAPPWYHLWLDSIVDWNQHIMTKVTKQEINQTSNFNNKNWKLIQKQIKLTDKFYKMSLEDYNPELYNFFKKYEKYDTFIEDVAKEKIDLIEEFKIRHHEEVAELNLRIAELNLRNSETKEELKDFIKKDTIEKVLGKSLYSYYFNKNYEM